MVKERNYPHLNLSAQEVRLNHVILASLPVESEFFVNKLHQL